MNTTRRRLEIVKFGIYIFLPISVMYIVGRPEVHKYMREHHMQRIPKHVYETRNLDREYLINNENNIRKES